MEAFNVLIAFRAWQEDKDELCEIARSLQLDESEIARRALREGLQVLKRVKLPGARETRSRT